MTIHSFSSHAHSEPSNHKLTPGFSIAGFIFFISTNIIMFVFGFLSVIGVILINCCCTGMHTELHAAGEWARTAQSVCRKCVEWRWTVRTVREPGRHMKVFSSTKDKNEQRRRNEPQKYLKQRAICIVRECTCIHIHIHIHIHVHVHAHIHIHIHTHTYMHACIRTYIHAYIHARIHAYITLPYLTLPYITLHYITLHYITYTCTHSYVHMHRFFI